MITIHHLENSRSHRVLWLLEVLELDYVIKRYERDPKTGLAPKELLKVSPLGKSPILEIDGEILPESGAIFEYLLSKYDVEYKFHPSQENKSYKDHLFWMHFAEGSLMWPLVMKFMFAKTEEKVPFFIKPVASLIFTGIDKAYLGHTLSHAFDYIESTLSKSPYLLGDQLSAVDILMSFPLEAANAGRYKLGKYSNIQQYIKRLKANKDYKSAIEKGGKYDY